MKAVVTHAFPGRPDDEPLSRTIEVGETLAGDLASVAISLGCAEAIEEEQPEPEEVDDGLDKLTRAELDALAADRAVDVAGAKTKGDVIAALRAAAAEAAAPAA